MHFNILILVDHASNFVPHKLNNLGITENLLNSHIAYDINIKELAIEVTKKLKAKIILGKYSRLVVDLNRSKKDPTIITSIADQNLIKGNINLNPKDKKYRLSTIYDNYHSSINNLIENKNINLIISMHSFSPIFKSSKRKIDFGILSNRDRRYSDIFIKNIENKGYIIGDNMPYSGNLSGDTLYKHALKNNILHTLIEVRNDLISTSYDVTKISNFLCSNINEVNKNYF